MIILEWLLTFLQQGQICVPMLLSGENINKNVIVFSKCSKANCWNLQCMIKVVNLFSYSQMFVPWELIALALGLYMYENV